jgi:hypothetical protein
MMPQDEVLVSHQPVHELVVLWQRLVVGGSTCERCGAACRRTRPAMSESLTKRLSFLDRYLTL